jgi:hypothetical protein
MTQPTTEAIEKLAAIIDRTHAEFRESPVAPSEWSTMLARAILSSGLLAPSQLKPMTLTWEEISDIQYRTFNKLVGSFEVIKKSDGWWWLYAGNRYHPYADGQVENKEAGFSAAQQHFNSLVLSCCEKGAFDWEENDEHNFISDVYKDEEAALKECCPSCGKELESGFKFCSRDCYYKARTLSGKGGGE